MNFDFKNWQLNGLGIQFAPTAICRLTIDDVSLRSHRQRPPSRKIQWKPKCTGPQSTPLEQRAWNPRVYKKYQTATPAKLILKLGQQPGFVPVAPEIEDGCLRSFLQAAPQPTWFLCSCTGTAWGPIGYKGCCPPARRWTLGSQENCWSNHALLCG